MRVVYTLSRNIKSSRDLQRFALTSFAPRPRILSQAREFVRRMMSMSSELLNCHDRELTLDHVCKSSSGTSASPLILLNSEGNDTDDLPTFQEEVPPP
jgi:hypothetical protein